MAELVARVAQIATEIDAAWAIAERERQRYDAFKKDLAETVRLLSDPAFAYAPKTKAGMEATLAEIRAEARQQGGVAKAMPQLANMRRQMRDAMTSTPNAGVEAHDARGERTELPGCREQEALGAQELGRPCRGAQEAAGRPARAPVGRSQGARRPSVRRRQGLCQQRRLQRCRRSCRRSASGWRC
ncbi:hypothetical protein AB5I41_09200 [Sphingomonas sp. MMS24-JH45]